MVKNLSGIYKPGSRVGYGMKVKPVMESLDLVIVGAEWGEGKRSGWLTSYTIACKGKGKLLEIGKVGTGIKELEGSGASFSQLTKMLKKIIIEEKGKSVKVKPEIIIEVNYEEIMGCEGAEVPNLPQELECKLWHFLDLDPAPFLKA